MRRIFYRIFGSIALVVIFFFGTLLLLDWLDRPPDLNHLRRNHIKQTKAALEAYRGKTGHYPAPFPDNPLTDISKEIGEPLPADPRGSSNQYRYVASPDGKRYGLLFHLEDGTTCIAGVGVAGTGWWGDPPACN